MSDETSGEWQLPPRDEPRKGAGRGRSAGSQRTQFSANRQPQRGGTVPEPEPEAEPAAVGAAAASADAGLSPGEALLADMHHVWTRSKQNDRTPGQKECRAWLKEDRKGFLTKYADLSAKVAVAAAAAAGTDPCTGEGGLDLEALCTELIDEALAKVAEDKRRLGL